jgi:hypothetical protein
MPSAELRVVSTSPTNEVTLAEDSSDAWQAGSPGPAFFEDTIYRLYVESRTPGLAPILSHRDLTLLRNIDALNGKRMLAGPVNFGRQVGLTEFVIMVGADELRLTIEVFPSKIDYAIDYQNLLQDVAAAARSLSLEYFRATYKLGRTDTSAVGNSLEWLTLLRAQLAELDRALIQINRQPQRNLEVTLVDTDIRRIRRANASLVRSIARGEGKGSTQLLPGVGTVHSVVPFRATTDTLDTLEHRWLRSRLISVQQRLLQLSIEQDERITAVKKRTGEDPPRLVAERKELAQFSTTVSTLLRLPYIAAASRSVPQTYASLQLLSAVGYGEAYKSLVALNSGLSTLVGDTPLSTMDVNDLYETWCFIELVRLSLEITGATLDLSEVLKVEESGIRFSLARGAGSTVRLVMGSTRLALSYNAQFRGLTGTQKPDVVIRIARDGWPDLIVVFDAKYRVDASPEYVRQFGTAGPPIDAVNALHRYRDAIVVQAADDSGQERPVVKGAALFPLSFNSSAHFEDSKLFDALEGLGIGALPFLPGNTDLVKKWLQALYELPAEQLAHPGPRFAGLRSLAER